MRASSFPERASHDRRQPARPASHGTRRSGGAHPRSATRGHCGAMAARRRPAHLRNHHDHPRRTGVDPRTRQRSVAAYRRRHGGGPRYCGSLPRGRRAIHRGAMDRRIARRTMPCRECRVDARRAHPHRSPHCAGRWRRCGEDLPRVFCRRCGAHSRAAQRAAGCRVLPDRRRRTGQRRRLPCRRRCLRRHGRCAGR